MLEYYLKLDGVKIKLFTMGPGATITKKQTDNTKKIV